MQNLNKLTSLKITILLIMISALLVGGCSGWYRSQSRDRKPASVNSASEHLGKVAYISQGKLFVRDRRNTVQITTYQNVSYPNWSPTGSWILFHRGDQLWVSKTDGTTLRMITPAVQGSTWLKGQDTVCYAAKDKGVFITSPVAGSGPRLIKPQPGLDITRILPSPDGKYLALEVTGQASGRSSMGQGIWKVDLRSGIMNPILVRKAGGSNARLERPRLAGWSADGKTVYIWHGSESASITADGATFTAVRVQGQPTKQVNPHLKGLIHNGWFSLAPKGDIGVLITGTGRETWNNKQLTLINLKNSRNTQLSQPGTCVNSFSLSPRGDEIAFSAGREEKRFYDGVTTDFGTRAQQVMSDRHLYISSLDGRQRFQLTRDSVYRDEFPVWNTKGDHLLFARVDPAQNASLWTIARDGSQLKLVVPYISPFDWFGYYGYVDWKQYFDYLP